LLLFLIFLGHEKLQSDSLPPPDLISWIAATAGVVVVLGLFMCLIVVVVKKRKTSKVHPQVSAKFSLGNALFQVTVILMFVS